MDSLSQKHCRQCGKYKAITEFYKNRGHKDGLSSMCKTCQDEKNRRWAISNREKTRGYLRKWLESHRAQERERLKQFKAEHREKMRRENRQYAASHKEQVRESSRRYYEQNKEKTLTRCREYRQARPDKNSEYGRNRRARKISNGGMITAKEWQEVLDKYGHKCLRCLRTDVKLSMDHVVPLKLGGTHTKDNVQPLCIPCNSWKNARIIDYRPF